MGSQPQTEPQPATPGEQTSTKSGRRTDPQRRDRIIDACLDSIAEVGVAGTSHRRVAAAADVPLGSMTYHFGGIDELFREAFTRFAIEVSDRFVQRMAAASTREDAEQAVTDIIMEDVLAGRREQVLTHELNALAAREPVYADLVTDWMARSRAALEQHFDPLTAQLVDAVIEGLTIHRSFAHEAGHRDEVLEAVRRITRATGAVSTTDAGSATGAASSPLPDSAGPS